MIGSSGTGLFDYQTTQLFNYNSIRWAAVHAQLTALATVDVDKGGLVFVDAYEGPGLADRLSRAATANTTTVFDDP